MYTKKRFSTKELIKWTRVETLWFLLIAFIEVLLYVLLDAHWLQIPFTPIALVGTAVAFIIGFQNNAAYGRIWEARQIWGGIVNTSRTFGMMVQDMVNNEYAEKEIANEELYQHKKTLIYRHIAWLTALRYAMRESRSWEYVMEQKTNIEWKNMIHIPEHLTKLEDELRMYLSEKEMDYVLSKGNKQTAVLYLQSKHISELKSKGLIWEFSYLELEAVLQELFTHQGKSERIKNFPYPRQFSTLMYNFTWLFIFLLPLGIAPQFNEIGMKFIDIYPLFSQNFVWLSVPFCVLVMWIFHTMNRIGIVGENPFEGSVNDVPISTIARGIEIDLRQNLGEDKEKIPAQFPQNSHVQM